MVKKRLIPCLDVAGGRVVKGVNFRNLREMGDPVELAQLTARAGDDGAHHRRPLETVSPLRFAELGQDLADRVPRHVDDGEKGDDRGEDDSGGEERDHDFLAAFLLAFLAFGALVVAPSPLPKPLSQASA